MVFNNNVYSKIPKTRISMIKYKWYLHDQKLNHIKCARVCVTGVAVIENFGNIIKINKNNNE